MFWKARDLQFYPFKVLLPNAYWNGIDQQWKEWSLKDQKVQIAANILDTSGSSVDLFPLYDQIRNSDRPLTSHDKEAVQDFVQQIKNDIDILHERITGTIEELSNLCRQLNEDSCRLIQKSSQVELCDYLISPPVHLPNDILERIFLACVESNGSLEPHPNAPPFQLAAVCYRWRMVACSTPTLWDRIHVKYSSAQPSLGLRYLKPAKTFLQRGRYPSISLDFPFEVAQMAIFFSFIKSSSLQFKRLNIESNFKNEGWLAAFAGRCDDLEEFFFVGAQNLMEIPYPGIKRLYLSSLPDRANTSLTMSTA
ncbi:hypothetical protein BDN72DRAFT_671420 [Pluteus cervinus]|uniref:Uncharacterized protein n=1 Tax=Pluteus cervinus TaxID=181527 RepID=A0ACD3B8M2_9AGAR|nr:hypothetical protein BDN72DRAFT_671420 [Pluteus cervinus]